MQEEDSEEEVLDEPYVQAAGEPYEPDLEVPAGYGGPVRRRTRLKSTLYGIGGARRRFLRAQNDRSFRQPERMVGMIQEDEAAALDAIHLPVPEGEDDGDRRRQAEEYMVRAMMKLVDLKGVIKPPVFTGLMEEWGEFRFRLENAAALLDLETPMARAARGALPPRLEPADMARSKFLYNLLVHICHGKV